MLNNPRKPLTKKAISENLEAYDHDAHIDQFLLVYKNNKKPSGLLTDGHCEFNLLI
jgi:hypothetical protein